MTIKEAMKLGVGFYIGYEFAKGFDNALGRYLTKRLKKYADYDFGNDTLNRIRDIWCEKELEEENEQEVVVMGFKAE